MARICRVFRLQEISAVYDVLEVRDLAEAEWFLALATMKSLSEFFEKKRPGLANCFLAWRAL